MTTQTEPPTIRVRIAVGIDERGEWEAYGNQGYTDKQTLAQSGIGEWGRAIVWVEADVPLPVAPTIEGTVSHDDAD